MLYSKYSPMWYHSGSRKGAKLKGEGVFSSATAKHFVYLKSKGRFPRSIWLTFFSKKGVVRQISIKIFPFSTLRYGILYTTLTLYRKSKLKIIKKQLKNFCFWFRVTPHTAQRLNYFGSGSGSLLKCWIKSELY